MKQPRFAGLVATLRGLDAQDEERLDTQNDKVRAALLAGQRIGLAWAQERGITRLAARYREVMTELKAAGYRKKRRMDPVTRCAEYWVERDEEGGRDA